MRTTQALSFFVGTVIAAAGHAALACPADQPLSFLGDPAPPQAPVDEVIVIRDTTRYVNVTGGETIRFIVGDRSFSWSFQTGGAHLIPFDLQRIAPRGLLNHPVTAYVDDDPLWLG